MKKVMIWTDGACSGNPGPGGWAALLVYNEHEKEISGGEETTTNNRMELTAVINALKALKTPCEAEIHSDSAYVVNAFNKGWIDMWQKNGWKTSQKRPVDNKDLWTLIIEQTSIHKVTFVKTQGHADDENNNRVDVLAVAECQKHKSA